MNKESASQWHGKKPPRREQVVLLVQYPAVDGPTEVNGLWDGEYRDEYGPVEGTVLGWKRALSSHPTTVGPEVVPMPWVIVSKKDGRGLPYWRPNSAGYTDSVTDAGKHDCKEAKAIVSGNHGDDQAYRLDDPALFTLISAQSMVRGKELLLYLQLRAALAQRPAVGEAGEAGVALIAAERQRQMQVKGWSPEHDDQHTNREIAKAAMAYVCAGAFPHAEDSWEWWPWDYNSYKKAADPIRNLVKAGALIAAEIDRLQRAAPTGKEKGGADV